MPKQRLHPDVYREMETRLNNMSILLTKVEILADASDPTPQELEEFETHKLAVLEVMDECSRHMDEGYEEEDRQEYYKTGASLADKLGEKSKVLMAFVEKIQNDE